MHSSDYIQGQIKEIDVVIDKLYDHRMELTKELTTIRRKNNEAEPDLPFKQYIRGLRESRKAIEAPLVVYQGEPGAFSEMACVDYFGTDVTCKGLHQFEDTFKALRSGQADYAVLPIENSSTGAVRQVYDLLMQYECYIVGETTVTVHQNLMALPGTKLEDIEVVYSHEQGLFQCERFLNEHPEWRQVAQPDTAGSAKKVAELGDPSKAAICSSRAADIYGLQILAENINFNSQNTTRFVVVSPRMELPVGRDKICISLSTAHQSGSLHEVLTIFAVNGLNLVRLESRPFPEKNWEYMFFIEFIGNLTAPGMQDVIHSLSMIAGDLRVFGNFRSNL